MGASHVKQGQEALSAPELTQLSMLRLSQGLGAKDFSSVEATRAFLEWAEQLNPKYNAYITITAEEALAQAKHADALRANGQGGPLTGIPVAHKDIFCTQGVRTSCGSKMLDNFISPYDATVVAKLKAAGMVMLGKTNMDEFAMGSSTENSYYGATKNPWDPSAVPGGSSGGSAAAVAARMAPVATATDTGGSIRQPASFCGVTGIKPTYGRVSRYGMIAYASSLDQGGVIGKTAEDCAMLLAAMSGFDARDSTSIDRDVPDYSASLNKPIEKLKIGFPKEWFSDDLNSEIKASVQQALAVFEEMGADLVEIELPSSHLAIPAYYILATSEASSNLARFDGVRYGHRCKDPVDLRDLYVRSRAEGFGEEVKLRILMGTYSLSEGYYDDYYIKAQKIRRLISDEFTKVFQHVDLIMGPVSPTTAFGIGVKKDDPVQMYLSDIYTLPLNLSGRPGMSIPIGLDASKKPIGLQVIGDHWDEPKLLQMTHLFQQRTSWHLDAPVIDQQGFG